ncbi:ABC transporter permease [Orbus sasakiae]|uniref:ABC transporter permease n=1 Tax=Orbus sasakiae TaxID=1078475 RepID=A0ABP9N698_9GAMM
MIWQWFRRELTSSSLIIVCFSLILAFATAFSLGNINDRILQGLGQQNREVLTGDRVLRGSYPIDDNWLAVAQDNRLEVSQQINFSTMIYHQDQLQLTDIKAVDSHYPLYGKLLTDPQIPLTANHIFVENRLLIQLGANIGDDIDVGDDTFTISGILIEEPDARFNAFQLAPRALIRLDDAAKTGAIQPGSRLTYRTMFKGTLNALTQLDHLATSNLRIDQRWVTLDESGNGALNQTLERAKLFLVLSSMLVIVLATTAIVVAMNHYCRTRYDLIAILKTLGANRQTLTKIVVGQWVIILLIAIFIGTVFGLSLETLLLYLLKDVLPANLPQAGIQPWLNSAALLFVISGVIGIRPYLQLLSTPPLRVLRSDAKASRWPLRYYLPITLLIFISLLLIIVGFNPVWWSLLLGIAVLGFALGIIGWGGLAVLRVIMTKHLALRLALNRLLRSRISTLSQFATFSLSLMLLTLLVSIRGGLLDSWQTSLPDDSPNYFVFNIPPAQFDDIEHFFNQKSITLGHNFPIVRARLTDINQHPVKELIQEGQPGYGTTSRELNLTWYADPAPYNPIVEGSWPPKMGEVSVSVVQAQELNIKLGDKLTFIGNAMPFTATVSSLRTVDWQSLKPNFVFMFDQQTLSQQPQYGFTSFKSPSNPQLLAEFNRLYPMVMLMDLTTVLTQISSLINQITSTLQLIVILVLICGVLLLVAQLQVGMQQRRLELRVYRILGAKLRLLNATLFIEFFIIGLISGLIAVIGAEIALYSLQTYVFKFPWQPNIMNWFCVPLISGGAFSFIGYVLSKQLLTGRLNRM